MDRVDPSERRVVSIHQPNYMPWLGYFEKLARSDVFVFLDDVQMPGGKSFVYRTRLVGKGGPMWLSVPTRRSLGQPIKDVEIDGQKWARKHIRTLELTYGKTPGFDRFGGIIDLLGGEFRFLADLNIAIIERIASDLGLPTTFRRSSSLSRR